MDGKQEAGRVAALGNCQWPRHQTDSRDCRSKHRNAVRPWGRRFVALVVGALLPGLALAFQKIPITDAEYERWPPYCQRAGHTGAKAPPGFVAPYLSKQDKGLMWKVGIWHYCVGLIHVQRAERYINTEKGVELVNRGYKDLLYSYDKISKNHPWAAEMAITLGRAHRVLGEPQKARGFLELAYQQNPKLAMIYSVMAMLHFDAEEYAKAAKVLTEGIAATDGGTAEMNYFLGLAYAKSGQIELAKKQEVIARERNYPMTGLARLIQRLEAKPDDRASPTDPATGG